MANHPTQPAAHTPSDAQPGTWHDLTAHLTSVAELAEVLASKFGAGPLGRYAGLWHDLGKYNPKFQQYLQDSHTATMAGQLPPRRSVPHAIHGAVLADELKVTPLSLLIAGHHAGILNQSDWKTARGKCLIERNTYEIVKVAASRELRSLNPRENLRGWFSEFGNNKIATDLFLRFLFSCLIDADRLDTERFANPPQYQLRQARAKAVTMEQLWQTFQAKQQLLLEQSRASPSAVNQVRNRVYDDCLEAAVQTPGIFRLCVPTGGGKTLSGLAFALKHAVAFERSRIIFAVPYTSIIEQTAEVYRKIFAELGEAAVLEHHSATQRQQAQHKLDQLESDENTEQAQIQAKLATQNWDAKLIVTTTVQLFESLLSHRPRQCRKLHNLVDSVIVLDEVQTLPIGLLSPILSVLQALVERYGVTVVLCTATQPALEGNTPYFKDALPEALVRDIVPPAVAMQQFQTLRRVEYVIPKRDEQWTWAKLAEDMGTQPQALVVLNTRRDAIAVLDALNTLDGYTTEPIEPRVQQRLNDSSVLHLSTLLCGKHRQAVLLEVRRRLEQGEPCTLVSTQVVEAGVDLDFPQVYRALGPLDRIVQAAGRCNREGRQDAAGNLLLGRVVIFDPAEGSKPPPGEYAKAMQRARELLLAKDFEEARLHEPDVFRQYFQNLYADMANAEGTLDKKGIQTLRKAWSFREVGEQFKFIETDTQPVVIPYDEAAQERLRAIARFQQGVYSRDYEFLQPYIVNLPRRVFNKADCKQEVKPGLDLWQWTGNYDPIRGVPIEQEQQSVQYDPMFLMQ